MILVWDTETTGLTLHPAAALAKQPRIIEFGGVLLHPRTGEIEHEFNIMINPGEAISAEITKITGITTEMVAHEPTFLERLEFFRDIFARATAMVGHNLPFDRDMLRNELARVRFAPETPPFPWPSECRHYCTMNMYHPLYGRNAKLVELYEAVMGSKYAQSHRALDDAKATAKIIQKEALWKLMS